MAGWRDAPVVQPAGGSWRSAPVVQPAKRKVTGTSTGMAQAVGALAEGAGSLVDIPVQAFNSLIGLGARGVEAGARRLGAEGLASGARRIGDLYEAAVAGGGPAQRLVRAFIPVDERQWVARAVGGGLGGAAGSVGVGRAILAALSPAQRVAAAANLPSQTALTAVARELATRPAVQAVAGAAGAGGAETARALGASEPVQVLSGMAAGMLAPGVPSSVAAAGRAAKRSVSRSGIHDAAAEVLRGAVSDRTTTLAALARRPEALPGVAMTTPEITQDAGLAGLARGLRTSVEGGARLSQRDAANLAARRDALLAALGPGNPDDVRRAAMAALRDLEQGVARRIDEVGPLVSPVASGSRLRGVLSEREKAERARASQLYKRIEEDEPLQVGAFDEATVVPEPERGTEFPEFVRSAEATLYPSDKAVREAIESAQSGTLLNWVKRKGGIKPRRVFTQEQERTRRGDGKGWNRWRNVKNAGVGDLYSQGITPRRFPGLYSQKGRTPDDLARMAAAEGLLPEDASANEFVEALIREVSLRKSQVPNEALENASKLAQELDAMGFDPSAMDDEAWYRYFKGGVDEPAGPDRAPMPGRTLSKVQAALDLLPLSYPGVDVSADIKRIVRPIIEAEGAMTVGEIAGRIQRLRAVARRFSKAPGQGANALIAAGMADVLDGFIRTQATGQQARDLAKARAAWRNLKATFAENEPGRILATNEYGRFLVDDAKVPGIAVPRGVTGESAAGRLRVAAGADEALQSAREELRRALDGANSAQVAKVARDYRETIRAYPELRQLVNAARRDAALLEAFPKTPLGRAAGDTDPEVVIKRLLFADDNGRGLRQLAAQLNNNKQALGGVRKALAAAIEGRAAGRDIGADGSQAVRMAALQDGISLLLAKTKGTAILEPEQRILLMRVKSELGRANFAASANRVAGSDTARNFDIGARIGAALARRAASGAGAGTIVDALINSYVSGRARQVNEVLVQAMLDPDLAAELLKRPTKERAIKLARDYPQLAFGAALGQEGAD